MRAITLNFQLITSSVFFRITHNLIILVAAAAAENMCPAATNYARNPLFRGNKSISSRIARQYFHVVHQEVCICV
jgi:hypothetical protein